MDNFELELKQGFLEEASQLLGDTESCFLALEADPSDKPTLEKIFRLAHNLKGSAKAVGFDELGVFTHEFENLLIRLKTTGGGVGRATFNLLLKCNDHLTQFIAALQDDINARVDSADLIRELQGHDINAAAEAAPAETALPVEEKRELSLAEQTALAFAEAQAEQDAMMNAVRTLEGGPAEPAPLAVAPEASALPEALPAAAAKNAPKVSAAADESIRVSLARVERLLNFVGELVILQTVLRGQTDPTNLLLRKTVHQMGKVTKEVQELSMSLRMVPLKQTFQKMQRIVRDTAAMLDKKVHLVTEGEDTELDKTILESLGDPLVHLIRNAVDHGLETSEKRLAAGKSEAGTVKLRAFHQSGRLMIEVKDDGGGINPERLKAKAVEKGILKEGAVMSDRDAVHLIFHPGFSTKAVVTEVSGRGVGMDVVKTNIEALQGEIQVDTEVGKGTTFRISLPLTLAIIDGMIVKVNEERYAIPLSHVHESVRITEGDMKFATGIGEVFLLRGENLPCYRMTHLINQKGGEKSQIALVFRGWGDPFAVLVDDIIGQHEIVIKKLGNEIQGLKGYSGSAILGDGRPALILEVPELVQQKVRRKGVA